jgi:hypothetical protein
VAGPWCPLVALALVRCKLRVKLANPNWVFFTLRCWKWSMYGRFSVFCY